MSHPSNRKRLDEVGHLPTVVGLAVGALLIALGRALARADAEVTAFANLTDE